MIKRVICIVCICYMFFIVNGCGRNDGAKREENIQEVENKNEREENMEQKRITKEAFLEYYGIAEEELEGIDINSFVEIFDIKLDDTDVAEIREVLQLYRENFAEQGLMNYGYMLEEPIITPLTQDNVNSIVRIVWQENRNEYAEALAFDFENERIYEGYRIEAFDNSYLIGATNDVIKEKVIQLIGEYDIYSWKDYYKGGSTEGTTANYNWQMAIEFSDGRIYQTGGRGLGDKARPENMYDFIAALRECEPENTSVSQ